MIPWGIILIVGSITFALRFSFFRDMDSEFALPEPVTKVLPLIPPAALAAMAAPGLFWYNNHISSGQVAATLVAAITMTYTRSFVLALGLGMVTLWMSALW